MSGKCWSTITLMATMALAGCRGAPADVDYETPKTTPSTSIELGRGTPVESRAQLRRIEPAATVKGGETVRVVGEIANTDGGEFGKIIMIQVLSVDARGQLVVSGAKTGRGTVHTDGHCRYELVMPAPERKGTYDLEVAAVDGKTRAKRLVAWTQLVVK